jgi:hypothetical protein
MNIKINELFTDHDKSLYLSSLLLAICLTVISVTNWTLKLYEDHIPCSINLNIKTNHLLTMNKCLHQVWRPLCPTILQLLLKPAMENLRMLPITHHQVSVSFKADPLYHDAIQCWFRDDSTACGPCQTEPELTNQR